MSILSTTRAKLGVIVLTAATLATSASAQVVVDPEIAVELPFDLAPIITAVMSLAVLVLILVAGPKISLKFAKRALRSIGNIF